MIKPIGLSDRQLRLVQTAAKAVPVSKRGEFLEKVAKHLTSEPSDAAVQAALNAQLDRLPQHYFNDSAPASSQQIKGPTTHATKTKIAADG